MATPAQVLQVEPEEIIKFSGAFSEVVASELKLTNPSSDQVAFKVKTTAPRRYAVRPNSGVLNPGETVTVSVMRQPYDFDPAERVRHKFMVQTVKLTPGQTLTTVWTESDPSTFMDTKLKVQFDDVPPSNKSSVTEEVYHRVVGENEKLSHEVVTLKAETQELRKLAEMNAGATKSETPPKGISLLCHEKCNIFIIIILLAVAFFGGLYASGILLPPDIPTQG